MKRQVKRMLYVASQLMQHAQGCNWMLWERSQGSAPQIRKPAPLTTPSSNCKWDSAAKRPARPQYSKIVRTKLLKRLNDNVWSPNISKDFLMIPSFWDALLETDLSCFSEVIFGSNKDQTKETELCGINKVLNEWINKYLCRQAG